jgi:hypothetical protein
MPISLLSALYTMQHQSNISLVIIITEEGLLPAVSTLCYVMRIVKCDHSYNILSYTYGISCKI